MIRVKNLHLGNNMYKLKCFFLLRFTFVSSVIIKQKKSKAKKKQGRKFLKNNLKKTFNLRTRWQKRVSSIEIIAYTNNLNTEKFKTLGLICRKLDATHFSKVKYGRGVLIQAPPYERGGGRTGWNKHIECRDKTRIVEDSGLPSWSINIPIQLNAISLFYRKRSYTSINTSVPIDYLKFNLTAD